MSGSIIVAIDGSAASGKGTLAKRIAAHFDFAYLDSGSLYRAIGVAVLRKSGDPTNEAQAVAAAKNLDITQFTPEDLRTEAAGVAASQVAAIPAVRAAILQFQRDFAHTPPHGKKGPCWMGAISARSSAPTPRPRSLFRHPSMSGLPAGSRSCGLRVSWL